MALPMRPVRGFVDQDGHELIMSYGSWDHGCFLVYGKLKPSDIGWTQFEFRETQKSGPGMYYVKKDMGLKGVLDLAYYKRGVQLDAKYDAAEHFGFDFTQLMIDQFLEVAELKRRLTKYKPKDSTDTWADFFYDNQYSLIIGSVWGTGELVSATTTGVSSSLSAKVDLTAPNFTLSGESNFGEVLRVEGKRIVIGISTLCSAKRLQNKFFGGSAHMIKAQSSVQASKDEVFETVVEEEFTD